ncbi:unnamed protein product [Fraxinus pennsylvanica]|uniref:non-specific serine/threonine protein kinase n=1 Tax=Fraxinus pennsylvanica TaxID=56036 RepID=A0AAD1Z0Q3_9LAMI|nr:unnamed protein product [Fraxinus pennsylvanica]
MPILLQALKMLDIVDVPPLTPSLCILSNNNIASIESSLAMYHEWEGRLNVGMSNSVTTAIRGSVRDMAIGKTKTTEKADRATVEQAIDPRTRMANVYHATKSDCQELAIMVYKTSVLVFKLRAAGIRCPSPLLLRLHVLVMEFIGKAGWAAPRLKDAALSLDELREGYVEMIMAMRTLYQKCKLVHGNLSEYNILYFEGHLYIIDVSQSADLDHPHAPDFLREDCIHVSDFFRKHGIVVMTIRELFDFIVDPTIDDDSVDSYLEEVQQKFLARGDVISAEEEIANSVFVQSFIPKTLDHVKNAEDDVQRITSGKDTGDMLLNILTCHEEIRRLEVTKGKPVQVNQKIHLLKAIISRGHLTEK